MSKLCVTKQEASKLLGVSERMINKYLHNGQLTVHHKENRMVMISVTEVYALREQKKKKARIVKMKMERNAYIEKRVAEGFTKEKAEREYDGTIDPMIAEAQEQKVPTRGEMLEQIYEARMKNPDKSKLYKPNFKYSKEYEAVMADVEKAKKDGDWKKAEKLSSYLIDIQINGTVTEEERQAEIDKTLELPIATVLAECKKYEKIVADCEGKLNSFDISGVQAKVDALTAEYEKKCKANAGKWAVLDSIKEEYKKAVDDLELELIYIPMNDIKLQRYRAKEFFLIYEARVKYYVNANRDLIEEEIQHAKRMEVRGSLADLAGYVEGE